jgi:hypothetical protein
VTTKKPTRRQRHAYSPELTDLICERLLDGTSLRQICQDKNMPARSAIIVWPKSISVAINARFDHEPQETRHHARSRSGGAGTRPPR